MKLELIQTVESVETYPIQHGFRQADELINVSIELVQVAESIGSPTLLKEANELLEEIMAA